MKILVTNPPWKKEEGRYGVRAGSRWPFSIPVTEAKALPYLPFPFFLAYTAALLEATPGIEVLAIDAIAEGLYEDEYLQRVKSFAPDIIIAEGAQASCVQDIHYAKKAKELCPNVLYLLAGPLASVDPLTILRQYPDIDCCLVGEYEWTAREVVLSLQNSDLQFSKIDGLAWRDADGMPVENSRRALGDITELPWPAYHHFPMLRYRDFFCGIPGPMVNMVASRGCPFKCSFCLWPKVMYNSHTYRVRDPEDVADEMAFLVREYGFKTIYFDDDTFNVGKKRIIDLAKAIKKRDLGICLAIMGRADIMDEDMLVALRDAGLKAVKYGLESASQEILDRCGKALDLQRATDVIRMTQGMGIKVHLTFTVGLPGETKESIDESIRLAWDLDVESFQLSLATPFPGTPFYDEVRLAGHLCASDAELFDGSCRCVTRTEALTTDEIEEGFHKFQEAWKAHRKLRENTLCSK